MNNNSNNNNNNNNNNLNPLAEEIREKLNAILLEVGDHEEGLNKLRVYLEKFRPPIHRSRSASPTVNFGDDFRPIKEQRENPHDDDDDNPDEDCLEVIKILKMRSGELSPLPASVSNNNFNLAMSPSAPESLGGRSRDDGNSSTFASTPRSRFTSSTTSATSMHIPIPLHNVERRERREREHIEIDTPQSQPQPQPHDFTESTMLFNGKSNIPLHFVGENPYEGVIPVRRREALESRNRPIQMCLYYFLGEIRQHIMAQYAYCKVIGFLVMHRLNWTVSSFYVADLCLDEKNSKYGCIDIGPMTQGPAHAQKRYLLCFFSKDNKPLYVSPVYVFHSKKRRNSGSDDRNNRQRTSGGQQQQRERQQQQQQVQIEQSPSLLPAQGALGDILPPVFDLE